MRLNAMCVLSVSSIVSDWNIICGMNSSECSRNTANPADMNNSLIVFTRRYARRIIPNRKAVASTSAILRAASSMSAIWFL